jgi:hypothetical protein
VEKLNLNLKSQNLANSGSEKLARLLNGFNIEVVPIISLSEINLNGRTKLKHG